MVLIAPGIARFTVNAELGGEAVANILDMQVDTTGGTTDRATALAEVAGDILNNWDDHILSFVCDDYVAQSVSWVDLDDANGPVGSRSTTSANTWPQPGAGTATPMPGNVAALVSKNITGSRGRRNGRMYLAGIPEVYTGSSGPNIIEGTYLDGINTSMASFLSGINDAEGIAIDVQRQLVVVHTQIPSPGADPVYVGYSSVSSLTAQARLATQRRRLR